MTNQNTDRWEELRPGFIRAAIISGILLAVSLLVVFVSYGDNPIIPVNRAGRGLIGLAVYLASGVFLVSGGMLVGVWLLNRFGDRPHG